MKKIIISILILIGFISCKQKNSKFTDKDVFRYNEHSNISTLDPVYAKKQAEIWPINHLFNGLVQLDKNLNVVPAIAKSWSYSKDKKTIDFILRKDVYFHKHILFGKDSTRVVVAKDVKFSFDRLLAKETASPGKWVLNNVANYQVKNDTVFSIRLKKAFPPFLGLLTMKYCSILPEEIVTYYKNDFREHPIGTGPYYFKYWEENTKLVLRKNNTYFEKENGKKLPYLEAIAITFLPDKQSEYLEFMQGNLDLLSGLDASYKDDLLTEKGKLKKKHLSNINLQKQPYLNTEYLGFFLSKDSTNPVNNSNLRKAINYGFDRKKMMTYLRNGIGYPANSGFIPKGLNGYKPNIGYTYNKELAIEYLTKYKEQTKIVHPQITISTNAQYLDLCEFIQQELSNIGLKVNIDVLTPSVLRQAKGKGELSFFRASWIADYPDAENYLSLFYTNNFIPNGPNYTHYSNKKFDYLYEKSIETIKDSIRYKLYSKMDSLMINDAPIVPLYYDEVTLFTNKKIKGLHTNAINLLDLKRVTKE